MALFRRGLGLLVGAHGSKSVANGNMASGRGGY